MNLQITAPIIIQIAAAGILLRGFSVGPDAWDFSWLCPYAGVILYPELFMYNIAPGKGMHPFKALYSIIIMPEFAFFTPGIVANGWHFSWITPAIAAAFAGLILYVEKSMSKNRYYPPARQGKALMNRHENAWEVQTGISLIWPMINRDAQRKSAERITAK